MTSRLCAARSMLLAAALLAGGSLGPTHLQAQPVGVPEPTRMASDGRPSVLVLVPVQPGRPAFDLLTRGVTSEFQRPPAPPINVFVEYLYDLAAKPDLANQQAELLRAKYATRAIDAVIAFQHPGYASVRDVLGLPSSVPLIFASLRRVERRPGTALVYVTGDEADSLAHVLPLLPPPDVVALVGGDTPGDRLLNGGLREKLERVAPGKVIDLTPIPLAELPDRVAQLPLRSVVVVGATLGDRQGQPITARMLMAAIAPVARGPVVVGHDVLVGQGALGGWLYSFEEIGAEAAKLALATLAGKRVDDLPTRTLPLHPTFDARQLRRFGIPESRLPADTRLFFREPTPWQVSRPWIVVGVTALALQSALLSGLFMERRRRHESEVQLANRSARQALIADVSSVFASLTHGDVDAAIAASLSRVGTALEAIDCALWGLDGESGPHLLNRWQAGPGPTPTSHDEAVVAEAAPRLRRDEVVHLDPAPGEGDASPRPASTLLLPLRVDGQVMAIFSMRHAHARSWSDQVADDLRTIGEIIATAVVRKRTDASMRRQLEALAHVNRVAGLGELAASLAHQLNQPLAAILSNAEVAQQLLDRPDPPLAIVREVLTDVIADDERAGGIIRHMRTMLKKQRVESTLVDVNAIVTRVTTLVAHDARLRGSSLSVELGEALPRVRIDSTQLKQVLLNLVVNATDATAAGTSRQPVALRTAARDGGAVIETQDRGPGIPPEALPRLFDPFFTTKAEGLGVGLSITRSIVEAAGGRISAHNVPEGGAVFRVWLPAADTISERSEEITPGPGAPAPST